MKIMLLFALLLSASPLFAKTDTTIVCSNYPESNEDWEHASFLSGSIRSQMAGGGDADWYYFEVGSNQKLTVTLDQLDVDCALEVKQLTFTWVWYDIFTVGTSNNPGLSPEVVVVNDGPSAYYYVGVESTYGEEGCYTLHYEVTPTDACEDVHEPNTYNGAFLYDGSTLQGRISSADDVDLFHLPGSEGQFTKAVLSVPDLSGYSLAVIDSRINDDGSYYELNYSTAYTSEGLTLYYDNPDERGVYVVVRGSRRDTVCYSLSAAVSSTPFLAVGPVVARQAVLKPGVYPVPARDVIYDAFESKVNAEQVVTVTDMSGKVVYRQVYGVVAGANRLEIKLPAELVDGVYILSDGVQATKFVLKH